MPKSSTVLLALVLTFSMPRPAAAEDLSTATDPLPPGTFTSARRSDEWKIKNALSAGPPWVTDKASVVEMSVSATGGQQKMNERVIRPGTNGWTCMPDVPGRPQHDPMCADETMMKWFRAVMEGKKPNITRVVLSYMLLGEARQGQNVPPAKDPSTVKDWYYVGPHVMVVLPDDDTQALQGINEDLSKDGQYVTSLNGSKSLLWVIPVGRGGERIQAYRPAVKHASRAP
jgi:hypothetical protein